MFQSFQETTLEDNDSGRVADIARSDVPQPCDAALCDNNPSHTANFSPSTRLG